MIKVVCCMCGIAIMLKPGACDNINGNSHGFCQPCLNEYCKENELKPIEIFIPEGAVINEEAFC